MKLTYKRVHQLKELTDDSGALVMVGKRDLANDHAEHDCWVQFTVCVLQVYSVVSVVASDVRGGHRDHRHLCLVDVEIFDDC